MELTERQIEIIDSILNIINTWKNTDDIDSVTLESYIEEYLYKDLEGKVKDNQRYIISKSIEKILNIIRSNK